MRIGVVIATYNGAEYISVQLTSILNQTLKPDIVVISDACSQDNTLAICEDILTQHPTIESFILRHTERISSTQNFCAALQLCDADYIFFSDQDDSWLPYKIEVTVHQMQQQNALLGFTNASIVDQDLNACNEGDLWSNVSFAPCVEGSSRVLQGKDQLFRVMQANFVTGMCMCITNELKELAYPMPNTAIHDKWFALVALCAGTIVAINEKCVLYRQHANNQIGTRRNLKKMIFNLKRYDVTAKELVSTLEELEQRFAQRMDTETRETIKEFLAFHRQRWLYLTGQRQLTIPAQEYKKYLLEKSGTEQLKKDMLYRFFCSKIKRRNKAWTQK